MCLTVKIVKKKPLRRVAWKVVRKNRSPIYQNRPAGFYRKGRTVREDPSRIVTDTYGHVHIGLHVYTSLAKAYRELKRWHKDYGLLIKVRVSPNHWHADGIKGDAVYSQLTVLT